VILLSLILRFIFIKILPDEEEEEVVVNNEKERHRHRPAEERSGPLGRAGIVMQRTVRRDASFLGIFRLLFAVVGLAFLVGVAKGACQPGRYTGASPSQMGILTRTCLACPAGKYTNTEGARSCTTCESGKYGPTSDMSTCIACPRGKNTLTRGNIDCKPSASS
jgi:hypothetical protein